MSNSKERLIERMNDIDSEIKKLTEEKNNLSYLLVKEHSPYKIGQKARYIRIQERNIGTLFNPKYEVVSRKEEILVCVNIRVSEWNNSKFLYKFKRLKSNGDLTTNFIHVPKDEIEWLDEYYEFKNN